MITYRMADGSLVWGEFSVVFDQEFFEDIDEPVAVIKETWEAINSEEITFKPSWSELHEDDDNG